MANWNNSINLVTYESVKDSDGFLNDTEILSSEIPAHFTKITRTEEEHSKNMGYTADLVVDIMKCNYSNEPLLIDCYSKKKYEIKRVYEKSSEILELTCSDLSRRNK